MIVGWSTSMSDKIPPIVLTITFSQTPEMSIQAISAGFQWTVFIAFCQALYRFHRVLRDDFELYDPFVFMRTLSFCIFVLIVYKC